MRMVQTHHPSNCSRADFPQEKSQGFASPPHDGFANCSFLLIHYSTAVRQSQAFFSISENFHEVFSFLLITQNFFVDVCQISTTDLCRKHRFSASKRAESAPFLFIFPCRFGKTVKERLFRAFHSGATSSASPIISPNAFCRSSAVVSSPVRI